MAGPGAGITEHEGWNEGILDVLQESKIRLEFEVRAHE